MRPANTSLHVANLPSTMSGCWDAEKNYEKIGLSVAQ